MNGVVVDTHALLWYLMRDVALSGSARSSLESVGSSDGTLYVSAISLVEIVYLAEKGRIATDCWDILTRALERPETAWQVFPVDRGTVDCLCRIPRDLVPDMPDRIVAATALELGLPRYRATARSGKSLASRLSGKTLAGHVSCRSSRDRRWKR
jgi:PIN domain nuclease of toxin-antitoxin system